MWLPALRGADPRWLAAFMALTAGLLTFLALDALSEALALQAALPGQLGGTGLVLLGVAGSYLALTFVSERLGRRGRGKARAAARRRRAGDARRHRHRPPQPRRGARHRLVVRAGRARARELPDRRLHGAQRHRGARHRRSHRRGHARVARAGWRRSPSSPARPPSPARGSAASSRATCSACSSSPSPRAPRFRSWSRSVATSRGEAPGGLRSGWVGGGFLAGVAVMYLTGLLIA